MRIDQPFANGIDSLLVIKWSVRLDTPLCIRSGSKFKWKPTAKGKSRNVDMQFFWNEPTEGNWNKISDLHYVLEVQNNQLKPVYQVPASSLRGALRSWSLQHLIEREEWPILTGVGNEEVAAVEISIKDVIEKLNQRKNGFSLIAGLFGLAFNCADETEGLSFASTGLSAIK